MEMTVIALNSGWFCQITLSQAFNTDAVWKSAFSSNTWLY